MKERPGCSGSLWSHRPRRRASTLSVPASTRCVSCNHHCPLDPELNPNLRVDFLSSSNSSVRCSSCCSSGGLYQAIGGLPDRGSVSWVRSAKSMLIHQEVEAAKGREPSFLSFFTIQWKVLVLGGRLSGSWCRELAETSWILAGGRRAAGPHRGWSRTLASLRSRARPRLSYLPSPPHLPPSPNNFFALKAPTHRAHPRSQDVNVGGGVARDAHGLGP